MKENSMYQQVEKVSISKKKVSIIPFLPSSNKLSHKKTVWIKMKVSGGNIDGVTYLTHPSLHQYDDKFECDTDDIYVQEKEN